MREAPPWNEGLVAFALALIDPAGLGGVCLRSRAGHWRDAWIDAALAMLPERAPRGRCPAAVETGRLLGGLDTAATLASGRPVIETGLLASASGGVLVMAMAERLPRRTAAIVADCMDRGAAQTERDGVSAILPTRFAVLALDEGIDDEATPAILASRLAFRVELEPGEPQGLHAPKTGDILAARTRLQTTTLSEELAAGLAELSVMVAPGSMRVALFLARAAIASAALRGVGAVEAEDAARAARLVLGPVAIAETAEERQRPDVDQNEEEAADKETAADLSAADVILAAAAATLPPGLLDQENRSASRRRASSSGRSNETVASARGARVGISAKRPRPDSRVDLLSTLRTAAPWQRIRAGSADEPLLPLRVRSGDLRYVRRRERTGMTAIFAVDASGSAAAARLAETKGAIELLLAECYVRRDEVALIAFRGTGAEMILAPTRSLVRAKRTLAGLPGGGPTPLAHGIAAATALSAKLERKGRRALTVFLTDGRANVALDGAHGRDRATADAATAARGFRAEGLRALVIDTAQRPQAPLARLAGELGADYLALPYGGAERISTELAARLRT